MSRDIAHARVLLRRMATQKLLNKAYYSLEFEGQPANFDLLVNDVTWSPIELTYDEIELGVSKIQTVKSVVPVDATFSVKDDASRAVFSWFEEWTSRVVNKDGTVNEPFGPKGYVKKMTITLLDDEMNPVSEEQYEVVPVKLSEESRSNQESTENSTFSITVMQFRS